MRSPLVLVGGVIAVLLISFGAVIMVSARSPESQNHVYGLITILSAPVVLAFLALLQGGRNEEQVKKNTEVTEHTRVDVRHDVRQEVNALRLVQEEKAKELAQKVETNEQELMARIEKLREEAAAAFREANNLNHKLVAIGEERLRQESEQPKKVEVVNTPSNPIPVVEDGQREQGA